MRRAMVTVLVLAVALQACDDAGEGAGSGGRASGPADAGDSGGRSPDAADGATPTDDAAPPEDIGSGDAQADAGTPEPHPCQAEDSLAFVGVRVLPMTGADPLDDQTVLIAGGQVCALGPRAELSVPPGARIIPGEGGTLLPGLADMHIHLNQPEDLLLYVANGVTTVRVMWGFPWTLELREELRAGRVLGPRLLTTGPIMDGDPPYWRGSDVVTGATPAAESVARQAEAGYDFIKVYNRLPPEAYGAIIVEAASQGLPVVGHVPDAVGLEPVLRSGQASIEHLQGYDIVGSDGTLEALTAELGVVNCPTAIVYERYARVAELQAAPPAELRYVHPQLAETWASSTPYAPFPLETFLARVAELHTLGAPLVAGTDAGNPFVIPGWSLLDELDLLERAGLSRAAVLESATVGAARLLGPLAVGGTVAPGQAADLLLLRGDPLEDLAHLRDRHGVLLGGRWLPEAELQQRLEDLAQDYERRYEPQLDCGPAGAFDAPRGPDSLIMQLRADIPAPDAYGHVGRDLRVLLDGTELDVGSASATLTLEPVWDSYNLQLMAFGAPEPMGDEGDVAYAFVLLIIPQRVLQERAGEGATGLTMEETYLYVGRTEQKRRGIDQHYRLCPLAVPAPDSEGNDTLLCGPPENTYDTGEQLVLGANLVLTTDPDTVLDVLGMRDPCSCWRNSYEPLACEAFDAL